MGPLIHFFRREQGGTGTSSWRVLDYEDLASHTELVGADEIVAPEPSITIRFDYPLGESVTREFEAAEGFTRLAFAQCICQTYRTLYAEEEVGLPGEAPTTPRMPGVVATTGPHGIHSHGIEDLFIDHVFRKAPAVYELVMGFGTL